MRDHPVAMSSATCPSCGQVKVWSIATPVTQTVVCNNDIIEDAGTTKTGAKTKQRKCQYQMPRHDWDYLAEREERKARTA